MFYEQITYFICKKWSSLHSLNLPNLHNTCQTCLSQVWWVLVKGLGKCGQVWRVLPKLFGKYWQVWRVSHISKKVHFGECEYSPKTASFGRVLKFAKFALELPLLSNNILEQVSELCKWDLLTLQKFQKVCIEMLKFWNYNTYNCYKIVDKS